MCRDGRRGGTPRLSLPSYRNAKYLSTTPYAILYRMIEQGYIQELPKRIAPDGRRRQYFGITEAGKAYFQEIWSVYKGFAAGVNRLVADVMGQEGGAGQ